MRQRPVPQGLWSTNPPSELLVRHQRRPRAHLPPRPGAMPRPARSPRPPHGRRPSLPTLGSAHAAPSKEEEPFTLARAPRGPRLEVAQSSPPSRRPRARAGPHLSQDRTEGSRAAAWGPKQLRPNTPALTLHLGWAAPAWPCPTARLLLLLPRRPRHRAGPAHPAAPGARGRPTVKGPRSVLHRQGLWSVVRAALS